MSILTENREFLQFFLNASSLLLKLDMQIFDSDRQCVAAAGSEHIIQSVGKYVREDGIVAQRYLKGEHRIHINNPGQNEACKGCAAYQKNRCLYKSAFFAPIKLDGEVVGIIGISSNQLDNPTKGIEKQAFDFLEALALLISDRLVENLHYKKVQTYSNFLKTAISNIQRGIILLNAENRIVTVNYYISRRFGLSAEELTLQPIAALMPNLDDDQLIRMRGEGKTHELTWKNEIFLAEVIPVYTGQEYVGTILIMDDIHDTYHMAYQITENVGEFAFSDILGKDPDFLAFKEKVHSVSKYDSTILLTGETGTGKELFARAIHAASRRRDGPFVVVNCGAIPESLIESELFGYERGAFTGANTSGKYGKFYLANQGTLFLDELENTPLYMQQKLLRAIENSEIERVGGTKPIPVDVRIIAATNTDLNEMVKNGTFRRDLYHRINVIPFHIPPLRERGMDVFVIADHFINKFNLKYGRHIQGLSQQTIQAFQRYGWEGNVRELQNTIEYAVNMCTGAQIGFNDLPYALREERHSMLGGTLKDMELSYIRRALDHYGWDQNGKERACRHLGISRATLYRKIKELSEAAPSAP